MKATFTRSARLSCLMVAFSLAFFPCSRVLADPTPLSTVCLRIEKKVIHARSDLAVLEKTSPTRDHVLDKIFEDSIDLPFETCGDLIYEQVFSVGYSFDVLLLSIDLTRRVKIECQTVANANNQFKVAKEVAGLNDFYRAQILYEHDLKKSADFEHLVALIRDLQRRLSMGDEDLSSSKEDDEAYVKSYHDESTRVGAAGPAECSPNPIDYLKDIAAAGPGPSLTKTDAWLLENLPTYYYGQTDNLAISQQASYGVDECTIEIHVRTALTSRSGLAASPASPIYIVSVKAASQGRSGNPVLWTSGKMSFSDVQPQTVTVMTDDTTNLGPIELDSKVLSVAFSDADKAQKVANAFRRLAALCGAKDDPF